MERIKIDLLENLLEKRFPQVYQEFLAESGSEVIDGFKVLGLPTKEVPMSVLEGTLLLRGKGCGQNVIALCINGTRALCLDLEKGNEQDAPLVEVDLTGKDFVGPSL